MLFRSLNNAIGYIGGGLCNYVPSVAVTNCTFADNTAANGDAVYNGPSYYYSSIPGSQPVLTNCILWGREDTDVQIFDYYDATSGSSLLVTYSCVQGGYSGVGNIDADPLFANADIGDLRLSAGSPCIDTGTADGAPEADILGIPRPQGAGFDMGAYEYDATPPNAPVVTGPDSPTNNPRPSFTWSSGGNGGAGLYRCGFAEGLWIVTETSETTFAPASDVSDGRYILYVQERDVAGNWSVSGTWAVTVDTVGPNAPAVRGPLSPCKNPRPVWAWSGDGGGGAHLYRYGYSEDAWLATDVTAVDLTPEEDLPDGSHTLYVQERDAAGNWSASGSFAVTVDATPPNAPAVGGAPSLTANALPEWTWVSGGNGGAGQYRFGFIENTWLAEEAATNSFTPAAPLPDGTHTLFVQERDAAGNWSASGAFTVTVDTTPPGAPVVVGSVSPPTSAKPAWTWISGGNGDIGLFRFGYAEGAWLSEAVALASFMPGGALPNGSHTLFVQERDAAGNWSPSGSASVVINTVAYCTVVMEPTPGGGITLDPPRPEGGYVQGTRVIVTAIADPGRSFTRWTGDLSGTANPATLVMDSDKTVGAVFIPTAPEGETPVEGEGEGENPPPVSVEEAAQRLSDAFAGADRDHNGTLSAAEAMAAVPEMTEDQFAQVDADDDGQITREELDAVLSPDTGCACRKSTNGFKSRIADLFLLGLAITTLLAVRPARP